MLSILKGGDEPTELLGGEVVIRKIDNGWMMQWTLRYPDQKRSEIREYYSPDLTGVQQRLQLLFDSLPPSTTADLDPMWEY